MMKKNAPFLLLFDFGISSSRAHKPSIHAHDYSKKSRSAKVLPSSFLFFQAQPD